MCKKAFVSQNVFKSFAFAIMCCRNNIQNDFSWNILQM